MWYKKWFDRDEYELVYQDRDDLEAEQLIDTLERVVDPKPGSSILDMGCGRGRHARSLARRGYRVTGIDLSSRAIERARQSAQNENLDIRFEQGDMLEPVGTNYFDGVVNLFTAFGYFEEEPDHQRALVAMATAIKPGGWFFQDFLNADHVADTLVPYDDYAIAGAVISQHRWIENGRINKKISISRNSAVQTFHESVRLLTIGDFRDLYEVAGLEIVQTFGDYTGHSYTSSSPRLLLYARKCVGIDL